MTRLFINGTPLGKIFNGVLIVGNVILAGFQAKNHVLNFMYNTQWADNIKHKGHHKSYKLYNAGETQVQGLPRYDDPGNIRYAITGKRLLSGFTHTVEK